MFFIFWILLFLYTSLFLLSWRLRDNSLVDIFWGVGFMVVAGLTFIDSQREISQILVTGLVFLWGLRISWHIGVRKLKEKKEDPRYAQWREEWGSGWYFIVRSFLQVYILQMILMLVVAIPILVVNFSLSYDLMGAEKQGYIFLFLGTFLSLFGLTFEAIADFQLKAFQKIKKPGQIFTTGLYRYSRHPNYFGESIFWLGISCISLPYSYLGLIGWITITYLLLFVSGVPLQEARYTERPEWEEYKSKTSVFIPWFAKKK